MMSSHHTRLDLHRNPHFRPVGSALVAKAAYRYGFKNVKNGFICAPHGPRNSVVRMNSPGDLNNAQEMKASEIAEDLNVTAQIGIGSPSVKLQLNVDTGVADTWVWSTNEARSSIKSTLKSAVDTVKSKVEEIASSSSGSGNERSERLYDPRKSKTAQEQKNLEWKVAYGDGSTARGVVYRDHLQLGNITVKDQDVEVAQKISSSFMDDVTSDGQLGLAFRKLNTVRDGGEHAQCHNVMDNLIKQNMIEKPLFTANLTHDGTNSYFTFGNIDSSRNESEPVFQNVDSECGYWEVECHRLMAGGQEMQLREGTRATLDTGINLILVPDEICEKIYSKINGAELCPKRKGYVVPSDVQLSDFTVCIGNQARIRIERECLRVGERGEDGKVFGAIQSCGDLHDRVILGTPFFYNSYVCFDQGNKRTGFMQKDIRS